MEVNATTETTHTESSTLGAVVGAHTIDSIPLVTRNYQQILSLSAGVEASVSDGTALGRGSLPTYTNGNMDTANSYQMDGISINNYANSSTSRKPTASMVRSPSPVLTRCRNSRCRPRTMTQAMDVTRAPPST